MDHRRNFWRTALVVAGLALSFILPPRQAIAGSSPIPSYQLNKMLGCSLGRKHSSWYFSSKRSIVLKQFPIGVYRSGWSSLAYAFQMSRCITKVMRFGGRTRYNLNALAKLSKLPIYAPKQGKQKRSYKVNYYNPDLIRWVSHNIPAPNKQLVGVKFRDIYNIIFRRFVRISAYTYLYLQQNKLYYPLLRQYHAAHLGTGGRKPSRYKGKRFRRNLKKRLERVVVDSILLNRAGRVVSYYYHAGHAANFWMRRGIDKTHKEFWRLLRGILKQYDPGFLAKYERQGQLGNIRIHLPKLPPPKIYTLSPQDAQKLPKIIQQASPNSKIQLQPGVYRYHKGLQIYGKHNLTLEGIGRGKVEIIVDRLWQDVITLRRSQGITIRRIHARHKNPPRGKICVGAVIYVRRTKRTWIDGCELNGSGAVGVKAWRAMNLVITRNNIHSNTQAAFHFYGSRNVYIQNNHIHDNKATLICTYGCAMTMQNNVIKNNRGDKGRTSSFAQDTLQKMSGKK